MSKRHYWIWYALIAVATPKLSSAAPTAALAIVLLIWQIAALVFVTILTGKRLRDFGWSAKWAWGVAVVWLNLQIGFEIYPELFNKYVSIDQATWMAIGLLFVWHLVVGLIKGDKDRNKYGPAPEA